MTDEFSFILRPSSHGVGVFAAHDIPDGSFLRLFSNETAGHKNIRMMQIKDVPKEFKDYCVNRPDGLLMCPTDFGAMPVGWFLNHSAKPNAEHRNYQFFAKGNIKKGEEITIDYNSLEEPVETREEFYIS